MSSEERPSEPILQRGIRIGRLTIPFYYMNVIIPLIFSMILPGMERLYAVLTTGVFVYAYSHGFRGTTFKRCITIIVQLFLVLVMVCWFNYGFAWMIFFPSASIGFLPSRKLVNLFSLGIIAVNLIGGVLSIQWLHDSADSWTMFLAALCAGLASVYGVRFQRQMAESRASLAMANETIEHLSTMAERERISRDLHDVMGHELSMITLKSQLAERLVDGNPERAKQEIRDIQNAARDALAQVREYIADMRVTSLSQDTDRARRMLESAGIRCDVEGLDTLQVIEKNPPSHGGNRHAFQVLTTLSLCIREGVTNIVKHSHANRAVIKVDLTHTHFFLSIYDDGIGLKRDDLTMREQIGGIGLPGMVQRFGNLDGSFLLWSNGERLLTVDTRASSHPHRNGAVDNRALDNRDMDNDAIDTLEHGTLLSFAVPRTRFLPVAQSEVNLL